MTDERGVILIRKGWSMRDNVVEVNKLSKQYGKQKALDEVSFTIKKGSIVGLIGPNGAGKTTIMKILGGLAFPTGGEMKLYINFSYFLSIITCKYVC